MGRMISIDPGGDYFAWGAFIGGVLQDCGRAELSSLNRIWLEEAQKVVVELPQVYMQRHWKGDPNDLIKVATTVGRILQLCPSAAQVLPREWKGTVPKKIMTARIYSKLDSDEKLIVDGCGVIKSKLHDVLDAVGLGLWTLGRLK